MKRLQTRKRFVNLSEEKMAQKQQHCKSLAKQVFTKRIDADVLTLKMRKLSVPLRVRWLCYEPHEYGSLLLMARLESSWI